MALASVTLKIDSYFGFSQDCVAFGSGEGGFRIMWPGEGKEPDS